VAILMLQTKSNAFFVLLLVCLLGFSLRAGATAPTYSVSVGSGSFSPNPICGGMTATASLTGSLNVQNPSKEIQESGDSWGWSPVVTGYAATSQSAFGAVPSGTTPPSVSATSGSATTTVSATADQTTSPGYYQVTVTGTDSFTLTDSSTSPPTVTSQSQSGSTTLEITVVTISDIQYNDPDNGWVSIPSDFVAMDGTTSPVRAIPSPSDASFPSGQPVWGGIASGSGTTATATFSTDSTNAGDETITATLGSATSQAATSAHMASTNTASSNTLQVSDEATTFQLTPNLLPAVTFPNRSVTSFGVGERVTLDFNVMPVGTPMPETVWSIQNSPSPGGAGHAAGQLLDNGAVGERGDFWAGTTPGSYFTFKLSVTSGPSMGKSVSSSQITIVAPSSQTTENRDPNYSDYHANRVDSTSHQGDASAGFLAIISILPGTVSFTQTQFGEMNCNASSASGCLTPLLTDEGHDSNVPIGKIDYNSVVIDSKYGNVPYNSQANQEAEDEVTIDVTTGDITSSKWQSGDATYNIGWYYHVYNLDGSFSADTLIRTITQVEHIGSDGSASITKDKATSSQSLNSPDNQKQYPGVTLPNS